MLARSAVLTLGLCAYLTALDLPNPVDIRVPLVNQKAEEWCWLAVAQMAIQFRTGHAPDQCEMLSLENPRERKACCAAPFRCERKGTMEDIQAVLLEYGKVKSDLVPPVNFGELYNAIRQGDPVIIAYESAPNKFHVVVARGMKFLGDEERITPLVLVNDPMAAQPLWVPYKRIRETWTATLIVGKPQQELHNSRGR